MNKVISKILGVILIIAAIAGTIIGINYFENYEEYFYVQIDNNKLSQLNNSDEMRFEYQLTGYNDTGKAKTIKFKTTRELRNQAYLKVLFKATGVNRWEEVQFDEIPTPAREQLAK